MVLCVKMTDDELSKSGDIPRGPQCPRRSYTAGRGSETRHNTTQVVIFPWAVGAKHSRLSRASVYRHVTSVICGSYKVCNRQVLSGPNMPVRSDVCPPEHTAPRSGGDYLRLQVLPPTTNSRHLHLQQLGYRHLFYTISGAPSDPQLLMAC